MGLIGIYMVSSIRFHAYRIAGFLGFQGARVLWF